MRLIQVVTLITCALAVDDSRFEKTNLGVAGGPVTAEKSVKIKPLGKSGLEGSSRSLLSPILFPIHYFEDKVVYSPVYSSSSVFILVLSSRK